MKTKKTITKILALFVAMTMLLSTFMVSVNAEAEGGDTWNLAMPKEGTLTLNANAAVAGKNSGFSAYKVLEAVSYAGQDVYEYKFTDDFAEFGTKNNITVDTIANTANGSQDYTFQADSADQLASQLEDYVKTEQIEAVNAEIAIGTPVTLLAGYYLILETKITEGYKTTKPILVAIPGEKTDGTRYEPNVTVTLKDQPLTTTKTIQESEEKKSESAAMQVGKEYTFEIEQQVPKYDDTYKNIVFTVTDTMSKGLDFVELLSVVAVKADGAKTALTPNEAQNGYGFTKPEKDPNTQATKLVLDFSDYTGEDTPGNDYYASVKEADKVVITYKAKLNKDASFGSTGNPNEVQPSFGDYPDMVTNGNKDVAITYSGLLELKKVGEDENGDGTADSLAGAKFTVYEDEELIEEAELVTYTMDENGVITETKNEQLSAAATTDKNGVVKFEGLGDRVQKADGDSEEPTDYWIVETEAPDGYVKLKQPIELVVKVEHPASVTSGQETATFTYEVKGNGVVEDSVNTDAGRVTFTVNNTKGFTLPVTGGVGRFILMACGVGFFIAAVVMFTKPRKKQTK